ncbi:MAG: MiaB/RimO family radical SAM methylthiotransferase [Gemmatimonadaceae bacterium]
MKIHLRTFGCRANSYDSEAVRELIAASGHDVAVTVHEADVAIFNSCAVTAEAEADLRQSVRRSARANPGVRSVVMGCAAALDRGAIRSLPTVSHVVPGADLALVASAVGLDVPATAITTRAQGTVRAVLRIQDGCDEHCTFCATTLARGVSRSRSAEDIIVEARLLSERHPEIVLTGIHIGSWGAELGATLGHLVERLVAEAPVCRFRLSSLEATEVDVQLASLFRARDGRVVPHLHAPLQSGSDRMLRRMGRHWYTASRYAAAVRSLTDGIEVFALGADVITGFPGETEDDHRATMALIDELPFTYLHVFPYSARPGTAAMRLARPIAPPVIERRAAELRDAGARKAAAYRARRAGGVADVVVTAGGPRGHGMTEDFLTVRVPEGLARGTRFRARLALADAGLAAVPEPATVVPARYLSKP